VLGKLIRLICWIGCHAAGLKQSWLACPPNARDFVESAPHGLLQGGPQFPMCTNASIAEKSAELLLGFTVSALDEVWGRQARCQGQRLPEKVPASPVQFEIAQTTFTTMASSLRSEDSTSVWSTATDASLPARRSSRARKQQHRVIHVEGIPDSVPAFLRKTYYILDSEKFSDCISWAPDGQTISISKVCWTSCLQVTSRWYHANHTGQNILNGSASTIFQTL